MNRLSLLVAIAMGLVSLAVARADPPSGKIAIGDITFNYKPASWRIVAEGDRLVATCLQQDCQGAVVDISRRPGEAGCTREAMVAEAERLFPAPRRAYANILRTGRLALVLAERNAGPDLSSPTFAFGCLAWEGSEYRFAMRPETVGTQSWIGSALHYLVSRATAPAAGEIQVHLGDISLRASTEIWTVADGTPGESLWLTCRMPTCHEPGEVAQLSVNSPVQPCPSLPVDVDAFGGETITITLINEAPDGIDFTLSSTDLGCRNSVPPHLEACSVHNGRSYHLSVLGDEPGCRSSGWSIPEGALIDLLKSARMAN